MAPDYSAHYAAHLRGHLALAVDNTQRRQLPLRMPWFERWYWLAAMTVAANSGAYLFAVLVLGLE